MERVFVLNEQGQREEVDAVRYFEYNGFNYFIYDKNEKDENGYVKLYVNKDQNGNIVPIAEDEWANLKSVFQNILKANRDGSTLPVNDLNLSVAEISVNPGKAFKLADNVVELLGKNKKNFPDASIGQINSEPSVNNSFDGTLVNSALNNSNDSLMAGNMNNMTNSFMGGNMANSANDFSTFSDNTMPNLNASVNANPMGVGTDNIMPNQNNIFDPGFNSMGNTNGMFGNTNNFGQMDNGVSNMNQTFTQSQFGQPNLDNSNNISFASPTINNSDAVDYKALYEEEKQKNESLTNELNSVKNELGMFTTKFEQLKQIIG